MILSEGSPRTEGIRQSFESGSRGGWIRCTHIGSIQSFFSQPELSIAKAKPLPLQRR